MNHKFGKSMLYLKNIKTKIPLVLLLLCICAACSSVRTTTTANVDAGSKPKKIIFLIGDGMGLSQVSSAIYYQDQPSNFESFPIVGLINTSSARQKITDSAAGATAFSAGKKTYNGAIGVDENATPLTLITEQLKAQGLSNGLIATSSITHATPASFFAKADQRKKEELIASQMPASAIDFFAGGGRQFFSARADGKNYLDSLAANNFSVDTTALKSNLNFDNKTRHAFLLAANAMPPAVERVNFLPDATAAAMEFLNQDKDGFFLMVESSQIDWAGHRNDAEYLIAEMLDFDKTIGLALDFARKDGETLVLVTADHETGGFTLSAAEGDYNALSPTFSTGGHSATLIPVFAFGPGAEMFAGVYQNTDIYHKLMSLMRPGKTVR